MKIFLKKKYFFVIAFSLLNVFLIFYDTISPIVISGLLFVEFLCVYILYRRYNSSYFSLLYTCIFFIPLSYISILGTSTSSFPISWYHLIIIILSLRTIFLGKMNRNTALFLFLCILFLFYGFANVLITGTGFDGYKQVLMLLLFMFSFVIGSNVSKSNVHTKTMIFTFICTCITLSLQIILQKFLLDFLGLSVGNVSLMGRGRIAFSGLLSDFSFATLYLACGVFLLFISYVRYKSISTTTFIVFSSVLVFSSLIVSSRTGLFALIVTIVLYILYFLFKYEIVNKRLIIVLAFGLLGGFYIVIKLISARGGQSLLDGSGRIQDYLTALNYWKASPFIGIGFGMDNVVTNYNLTVPHNFFIQYLCQGGIIGLFIIIIPFVYFIATYFNKANDYKWLFILIFVGAMVIPDITSSRFLTFAIILICICKEKKISQRRLTTPNLDLCSQL